MKNIPLAKVTRPKVTGIFPRERLFRLMDTGRSCPVLWITGPPGAGKTTLVTSYLDIRKLPCLWYQVDEGDADVATFFYYMGMAAKKAIPAQNGCSAGDDRAHGRNAYGYGRFRAYPVAHESKQLFYDGAPPA